MVSLSLNRYWQQRSKRILLAHISIISRLSALFDLQQGNDRFQFARLNLIYWQSIGAFFFLLALLTSISITRTCNDQLLLLLLLPITQVFLVATANEDSRLAVTSSTELCEPPSLRKKQQNHWNVFFAFWSAVSCGYGLGKPKNLFACAHWFVAVADAASSCANRFFGGLPGLSSTECTTNVIAINGHG